MSARPERRAFPERPFVIAGILAAVGAVIPAALADLPEADRFRALYERPATIPFPADNAYTPQKAELGKILYFDPRLSRVEALACASCHNASFGWEDGRPRAIGEGMQPVGRHSPTILNLAWSRIFFWDGRAASLEEQAVGPIQNPVEMNMPLDGVVARLRSIPAYRERFEAVFPGEGVTADTIAKAIATFERTIVSGRAPFDTWADGDESAISEQAKRGFVLFNTKGACAVCHSGWRFTNDSFHDIGLEGTADPGRGALFEGVTLLRHAFKTPGLRNIAQRAPFMHDGSVPTLRDAVQHYVDGIVERPSLSPSIRPVALTAAEVDDIVAFLETLTSDDGAMAVPVLP